VSSIYDKLKQDLITLTQKDTQLKVFGAESHKYRFNPTLSESYILQFEEAHEIHLPDDYRMFLKEVANGGAGPHYGMYRLEDYYQSRFYDGSDANYIGKDFLKTPFPYTKSNPLKPLDPSYRDEIAENLTDEEYAKEFSKNFSGAITLAHQGCGYYDMLIVSGEERGTVWMDATASDQGIRYAFNSFAEWYFYWLKSSIVACRK